jgi:hypothetical protein
VGGEIFLTCPVRPWSPPSLLYNRYRVFPGGKERPGRDADPSPRSSAVGHERVELYLYSPYGPYGLYRVSVPVQGCILPFSTHQKQPKCVLNAYSDMFWYSTCFLCYRKNSFVACQLSAPVKYSVFYNNRNSASKMFGTDGGSIQSSHECKKFLKEIP